MRGVFECCAACCLAGAAKLLRATTRHGLLRAARSNGLSVINRLENALKNKQL